MKALKKLSDNLFKLFYFLALIVFLYSEIKQAHWYSVQIILYIKWSFDSFCFLCDGYRGTNKEYDRLGSKTKGMNFPFFWRIVWAAIPLTFLILVKLNIDHLASIQWTGKSVTQAEFVAIFKQVAINAGLLYIFWRYNYKLIFIFNFYRRVFLSSTNALVSCANGHYFPGETMKVFKADSNKTEEYELPNEKEYRRNAAEETSFWGNLNILQQYNIEKENARHAQEQAKRDRERNDILRKQAEEQKYHNEKMRKHAEELERLARRKA